MFVPSWWCWHLVARLQCIFPAYLWMAKGRSCWRFLWMAKKRSFQCLLWMVKNCNGIWKEVIFLYKCKLVIIFIFSVCHLMKPYSYWHSLCSLGCVSWVGCGRDIRYQTTYHLQFCWWSRDQSCRMLFRRFDIPMKLLMFNWYMKINENTTLSVPSKCIFNVIEVQMKCH